MRGNLKGLLDCSRNLLISLTLLMGLCACTHSDQSSESKLQSQKAGASPSAEQVDKEKQKAAKELIPYFNRPPVGTPIETH